jgi:uncharacterized protein (UPF0264 family)
MDTSEKLNAAVEELLTRVPEARPLYDLLSKLTDEEMLQLAEDSLIAALAGEITPHQLQMLADMALIIGMQREAVYQERAAHSIH